MKKLIDNPEPLNKNHYLLKIESDGNYQPGQFINIRIQDGTDPLIRRPFSVFNYENGILEVVIRVIGRGTRILSERSSGPIDFLGPLGKGFSIKENRKVLIAGGGVGNAPLYYLSKKLAENNCSITYIYGASSAEHIFLEKSFSDIADEFHLYTDDGSKGKTGYAIQGMKDVINNSGENFDHIYICGPTPMMKAGVAVAEKIPVEVSMENYFGCGIGLCMGCSVETHKGLQRACVEGPVFNGHGIDWLNLSR